MPVYVEESILALEKIYINGGRRGYLVGIAPQVLVDAAGREAGAVRAGRLTTVSCALYISRPARMTGP